MVREALVLGLAVGVALSIMAWIIWSERPGAGAPAGAAAVPATALPAVDTARIANLEAAVQADPADRASRVALGDVHFRAHRFADAVPWYEQALDLDAEDASVRANLGVSYFYSGSLDDAVSQLDQALRIAPDHARAWLFLGLVRAFGEEDLAGATAAWERVIELAPESREADSAREALARVPAELGAPPAAAPVPGGP